MQASFNPFRRVFAIPGAPVLIIAAALAAGGCAIQPKPPAKSQLEMRQMQTREYERIGGGPLRVMKAVINVLQDEGYIVRNADKELGFINAAKETDIEDRWERLFAELARSDRRFRKNSVLESSVSINEFGQLVRVRAVFQLKVLDNFGSVLAINQIDDPAFYQEFFSKVDKGIFLEKERL